MTGIHSMRYKVMERANGTFDVVEVIIDRKEVVGTFETKNEALKYMTETLGQEIPLAEVMT